MSERYSKIFTLPQNLYIEASPVIVRAGALLKDNTTNRLIAQLKFSNIQNKNIKLVKVEIECLDGLGRSLEDVVTYEYLDLNVARSGEFGAKTPVAIKNAATRSFTVRVIEVGFSDNTVWTNTDGVWESLGEQLPISAVISDGGKTQGLTRMISFGSILSFT